MKNLYHFLANYPAIKIKKLFTTNLVAFIIFAIIESKVKLSLEIFYLAFTILMWTGTGFIFSILFIKQLNTSSTNQWVKILGLSCCGLVILASYLGPLFLYLLSKKIM